MTGLLVFALTLVPAVLLSQFAKRSVLSTAVVFIAAGIIAGQAGWIRLDPEQRIVSRLVELALVIVLYTEGMEITVGDLRHRWKLPGRALFVGMPLTMVTIALLARWMLGMAWAEAFLLGAVIMPTDPVFAQAIVGQKRVPERLRDMLNIESGFNDGLALPAVLVFLAIVGPDQTHPLDLVAEVTGGVVIGVIVPWIVIHLERTRFLAASEDYAVLMPASIGILVLALASVLHANELLAAFSAGITVATISPEVRRTYDRFGHATMELVKLAAILVFASLIRWPSLRDVSPMGYALVAVILLGVRPVALGLALLGSRLAWRERLAAIWFGPRGFASVFFALLVLKSGLPNGDHLFHLASVVVVASMFIHSSTDVILAGWVRTQEDESSSQAD